MTPIAQDFSAIAAAMREREQDAMTNDPQPIHRTMRATSREEFERYGSVGGDFAVEFRSRDQKARIYFPDRASANRIELGAEYEFTLCRLVPGEWQPIETAPRDGTEIQLNQTPPFNDSLCVVRWSDASGAFIRESGTQVTVDEPVEGVPVEWRTVTRETP